MPLRFYGISKIYRLSRIEPGKSRINKIAEVASNRLLVYIHSAGDKERGHLAEPRACERQKTQGRGYGPRQMTLQKLQ